MKHEVIENLEQKVREGRFLEVKQTLSQLNLSRIPREQTLSLANIAYRINSPGISIRILQPIIHRLIPGSDEVHNLLQILASDLYKPFRLGNLFSQLFPGEYYDPHTSPDRVHQILKRLRQALSETPLNIVAKKDLYSLNTQADVELSVTRTIQLKNAMELKIEQMIDHFGISQFSASEVKSLFNVSRTQAYYILQEAQKFGLSKTGQGVHSRYHFEIKRAS